MGAPTFLLKNWRLVGLGLLLLALGIQTLRLNSAHGTIERQRDSIAQLRANIATQNAAIERMRREGEESAADQQRRLEEARRQNARQEGTIAALRRGAVTPRPQGGQCTISPELRNAQGL